MRLLETDKQNENGKMTNLLVVSAKLFRIILYLYQTKPTHDAIHVS
jgi:hypothetical protein